MIVLDLSILNQKGTPMFYSDTLAARPAAGIVGRIFIATDSPYGIYRDTGSAWDQISGASTFSGSLATGQVAFGSALNTIAGSAGLTYSDSAGQITLSKSQNAETLLNITNSSNTAAAGAGIYLTNNSGYGRGVIQHYSTSFTPYKIFGAGDLAFYKAGTGDISFLVDETAGKIKFSTGASATARMTLAQTGNLLIGRTIDAGYLLDVDGNSIFRNALRIEGTGGGTINNFLYSNGGITQFSVNNSGDAFARNTLTTPQLNSNVLQAQQNQNLTISAPWANNNTITLQTWFGSDITTRINLVSNNTTTSGNHTLLYIDENFVPTSGTRTLTTIRIIPIINQTGGANGITRGLYVQPTLTAAADWRSVEWNNNTGWGLYGAGTALNYLGGTLGIKTTSPYSPSTFSLDVNGGLLVKNTAGTTAQITLINADPSLGGNNGFLVASVGGTSGGSFVDFQGYYGTSIVGSTALRLNAAGGAVIVNSTTNSGEQFQLTGTIRVNGQTSGSAGGNSGQHLIINCDGTSYKIALLNP